MPKDRMRWIALAVGVVVAMCSVYATERQDGFLQAVAETKTLIDAGQEAAAQDAFDALKADFPTFAGDDLDLFIKGELCFCKGRYTTAVKHYEKLLTNHPRSPLYEAALDRELTIATAYLAGRKKTAFLPRPAFTDCPLELERAGLDIFSHGRPFLLRNSGKLLTMDIRNHVRAVAGNIYNSSFNDSQ